MASDVVKGGWAPDEDEKLVKGIERYGTRYDYIQQLGIARLHSNVQHLIRWSLVASMVQTRNSDRKFYTNTSLCSSMSDYLSECAKRWTDTLNPAIDRTTWTAEAVIFIPDALVCICLRLTCRMSYFCKQSMSMEKYGPKLLKPTFLVVRGSQLRTGTFCLTFRRAIGLIPK